MTEEVFNNLINYIVEKRIKSVMCSKSAEYAAGGDKLYNFKRSAEIDNVTPIQALRGMDLKHRTSISDMIGVRENQPVDRINTFTRELWEEKLTDHTNYIILMWALLAEENGWEI